MLPVRRTLVILENAWKQRQIDDRGVCIITPSHPANVHVTKTIDTAPNIHERQPAADMQQDGHHDIISELHKTIVQLQENRASGGR